MIGASRARSILALLVCLAAMLDPAASRAQNAAHLTRQRLIGTWRLVSIDCSGPKGPIPDPFYQPDSMGIIIYDSTGWMSVHIGAPHRPAWKVPASRAPSSAAEDARLKAAAFDTYYAYFGTWDFDARAAAVTHHVNSSLIPAESGLDYTQKVSLEKGRLVFTTRSGDNGEDIVRRKVWERAASATR